MINFLSSISRVFYLASHVGVQSIMMEKSQYQETEVGRSQIELRVILGSIVRHGFNEKGGDEKAQEPRILCGL